MISDIDLYRLHGNFDAREGPDGPEGPAGAPGDKAANENTVIVGGEEKPPGSLEADALLSTCTVSAIVLWDGIA